MRVVIAVFCALCSLVAAGSVSAGEEPAAPAESDAVVQLERTIAELRKTREERYRLEAAHRAEIRSLEVRVAEGQALVRSLEPRLADLEKEAREASAELDTLRVESAKREAVLREADGALDRAAERLRALVNDSIPFRAEERLRAAAEALARPVQPSGPGEAETPRGDPVPARVRRFQQVLDAEIALGSSSEAFLDRVELGPEDRPRARCMRLGLVELAFLTEDGSRSGVLVWDPVSGRYRWKTDLSFGERWGLKRGLEILERRRPPVFLDFPVDLGRVSKPGASPAEGQGGKEAR